VTQPKHRASDQAGRAAAPVAADARQHLEQLPHTHGIGSDGEPAEVAERLVHATEHALGLPGVAVGHVADGRYRTLASSGVAAALSCRVEQLALADEPLASVLAGRMPMHLEERDVGGRAWLVTLVPIRSKRVAGALHLVSDLGAPPTPEIVGLGQAAAAVTALALDGVLESRRLEAAARWKGAMLTSMAHDLRTPLNALVGYTSLLREGDFGPLTASQLEVVGTLERQALELVDLLGAALDVARLETGRMPVRSETVDLAALFRQLADGTFAQATRRQAVSWQIAPGVPPLSSDRVKIKQIVQNLVDNALKYAGNAPVEVSVSAAPSGETIRLAVRDRGEGIAGDVLPSLFEPGASGGAGTGFGLYIVRSFVEALGGRVAAHSTPGQGTVVAIELPVRAPERTRV
jgi:signal transduction histidine kinase